MCVRERPNQYLGILNYKIDNNCNLKCNPRLLIMLTFFSYFIFSGKQHFN